MARATCAHRPERVPSAIPARRPAAETSWQGKPAVRTSIRPYCASTCTQSTAVMSPRLGTLGQWWARMRAASWCLSSGSYWQCQTTVPPKMSMTAWSSMPVPVQSEAMRGSVASAHVVA